MVFTEDRKNWSSSTTRMGIVRLVPQSCESPPVIGEFGLLLLLVVSVRERGPVKSNHQLCQEPKHQHSGCDQGSVVASGKRLWSGLRGKRPSRALCDGVAATRAPTPLAQLASQHRMPLEVTVDLAPEAGFGVVAR